MIFMTSSFRTEPKKNSTIWYSLMGMENRKMSSSFLILPCGRQARRIYVQKVSDPFFTSHRRVEDNNNAARRNARCHDRSSPSKTALIPGRVCMDTLHA